MWNVKGQWQHMLFMSPHKYKNQYNLKRKINIFPGFHLVTYELFCTLKSGLKTQTKHFKLSLSMLLSLEATGGIMWGYGGEVLYLLLKIKSEETRWQAQMGKYTNKYGINTHGIVSTWNRNNFNHRECSPQPSMCLLPLFLIWYTSTICSQFVRMRNEFIITWFLTHG